jgi:hypothetical protein
MWKNGYDLLCVDWNYAFSFNVIFQMVRNRHTLVLRKIINNKKIVQKLRFRQYVDSDGVEWFKVYPGKKEYVPAPASAIDVSKWGSMWVEAYETEDGEVNYINDVHDKGTGLESITTSERSLTISQIKKAHDRKRKKLMEYIPTIVAISGLVIIVVCLFIFWADIAEPVLTMGDKLINYEKIQLQQLEILKEIKLGMQRVEGTSGGALVPD